MKNYYYLANLNSFCFLDLTTGLSSCIMNQILKSRKAFLNTEIIDFIKAQ